MRDIKFRQWNSIKNRYQYDIGVTGPGSWSGPAYCTWETYPLEQYTGLKDKNGREIYEGDIDKDKCIIRYLENRAAFMRTADIEGGYLFVHSIGSRIEIIGNIHENTALLGHNPGPSAE